MSKAYYWENPRDRDNEVTVVVHADGSINIDVADEKAVDSYNSTFNCDITLPPEQATALRDYLNACLPKKQKTP